MEFSEDKLPSDEEYQSSSADDEDDEEDEDAEERGAQDDAYFDEQAAEVARWADNAQGLFENLSEDDESTY